MTTEPNYAELMEAAYPFEGSHDGCRLRILGIRNYRVALIGLPNGRVMIARPDTAQINIANSDWYMGDRERKAFAALAGIPFAEVRKAISKRKAQEKIRDRERAVERCLREAERYMKHHGR